MIRLATWNVNSLNARLFRVEEWLGNVQPDVIALQETKLTDDAFPLLAFKELGYDAVHYGQGQWNGVAILSKVGIDDVVFGFGDDDEEDAEARVVTASCGGVRVTSVYVPNGRELNHDHYHFKLRWLTRLRAMLERDPLIAPDKPYAVMGDFNIAPDDRDVYDPAQYIDTTHTSPAEREALQDIEAWGVSDVFRRHYDAGGLFSWWDYRAGNFHKGLGMRIDLILATAPLAETSTSVLIDRNARKGQKPSDHAPVVADFALAPP